MTPTIICKHVVGLKVTHNRDGFFTRAWRLWSDGRVERTNSKSKYQPMRRGEQVPAQIAAAAAAAGVTILHDR